MGTFLVDSDSEEVQQQSIASTPVKKRVASRANTAGSMRVVEFILGNELFAIDLFDTREVINTTEITPLPNTPSFIKGIIDLRGVITTIIDLKEMMKITKEAGDKKKSRIIQS